MRKAKTLFGEPKDIQSFAARICQPGKSKVDAVADMLCLQRKPGESDEQLGIRIQALQEHMGLQGFVL